MLAFEFADQTVKPAPTAKRSTAESHVVRTGARMSSALVNAAAPMTITLRDARPNDAARRAPASAPAPNTADSSAYTHSCVCSVLYASTGKVTLKLKQNVLSTTVI